MIDTLRRDLRWAIRRLRSTPAFSSVVVLTIALAIGANAALVSIVNALVLRHLPVRDPDRLVSVRLLDQRDRNNNVPLATVSAMAEGLSTLDVLGPYSTGGAFVAEVDGSAVLAALDAVGQDYFSLIGVHPEMGRFIGGTDVSTDPEVNRVVVLGHAFWRRVLRGSEDVLGQSLKVEGVPLKIIGVAPAEYTGIGIDAAADVTVPVTVVPQLTGAPLNPRRPIRSNFMIGRLRSGATVASAQAELTARWPTIRRATVPSGYTPTEQAAYRTLTVRVASVASGLSTLRTKYESPLVMLLSLAATLLLMACANLAGLFLVRHEARSQEFAVARAIGSGTWRLVRQAMVESGILSGMGVAVAIPVAWFASKALGSLMWTGIVPMALSLTPDARVLAMTAGLAILTSLTTGVLPAWIACRQLPLGLVSLRATTRRASRLSEGLIVGQVVLCSVLLCVAGLFARSLTNLRNLDLGFQSARVLVGRLVSQPRISINLDRATYSRDLLTLVARQPGVDSAALVHLFPAPIINAQAVGSADASDHSMDVTAALDQVSPGFFRTVGMSLVAGRDFQWGDDIRSRPVAIVSADLARRIFPRGDAIGRHIHIGAEPKDQSAEVVGIVSDARLGDIRQSPPPAVFRPLLQEPMYQPIPVLVVRTETAPLALADVARKAVSSLGQEYAPNLSTLDEQVNESLLQERILAIVSWLFAGLALLLGLLGLFALLAHTVALRTREIGVRVALGATAGRLVRAVMLQGLTLTGIGVAVGVPTAIAAARFVRSLLFSLSPSDPLTVGFTALALLAVGPLAAWWPARAAARVDPVTALRAE